MKTCEIVAPMGSPALYEFKASIVGEFLDRKMVVGGKDIQGVPFPSEPLNIQLVAYLACYDPGNFYRLMAGEELVFRPQEPK